MVEVEEEDTLEDCPGSGKPSRATDSDVTDDDIVFRYDGKNVVGITILHASQR